MQTSLRGLAAPRQLERALLHSACTVLAVENMNWDYCNMNILILSGSPRKGGNTELLVEAFVKGALQKHHVEVVSVRDYKDKDDIKNTNALDEAFELGKRI